MDVDYSFKKGNKGSILFLRAYKDSICDKFINSNWKYIIKAKWNDIKIYYLILAILFWLFMSIFTLYLFIPNIELFIFNFILLSLLLLYEIINYIGEGNIYF